MAAHSLVAEPPCAVCGTPSARIELIAPGDLPARWDQWQDGERETFTRHYRNPARWHLLYQGPAAGSDLGQAITADRAELIAAAVEPPLDYSRLRAADFYDGAGVCQRCGAPYCKRHWRITQSGMGYCPRGHEQSLDPLY